MMKKIFWCMMLAGASCIAQEKSLLWKISGKGLKQPSYLYGTIHATCDATLDKATIKAMTDTKQLYLELDMDDPALQGKMMTGMMMKNGTTLQSLTTPDEFNLLNDFMKEATGMPATMMNSMKPFMLSSMFLPSLMECPMQSVEQELMKLSQQQGEEIFGLEEAVEQLAIFDAIPYKEQMTELMKSVKDKFESDKLELKKLYEVYQRKDLEQMHEMMASSDALTTKYRELLLDLRNEKWISKIEEATKAKATFFGVGAAHLGGEKGVIKLLKEKGYKVEPVF